MRIRSVLPHGSQARCLTAETCNCLITLLDGGFSLPESLRLLDELANHAVITRITAMLETGKDIRETLGRYLPVSYRPYFEILVEYMSVREALDETEQIVTHRTQKRNETIGKLAYPLMLMGGMCVGILVFTSLVFPSMIAMAEGFGMDTTGYVILQKVVQVVDLVVMGTAAVCAMVLLIGLRKSMITRFYRYLIVRFPDNLLVRKASQDFAWYFVSCLKHGISTKDTMEILMRLSSQPLVSHIASRLDGLLNSGEAMDQAMKQADVEGALVRYFTTAYHSSSCSQMMDAYLAMTSLRNERTIRRFTDAVQLFSYGAAGVIIVLVYQILTLPMQMIGTM
ncbi:MAG: type II secretion system F family protein [Bulleidia sp.]